MIDWLALLVLLVIVGIALLIFELLWRKKLVQGEIARKNIHMAVGTIVAFSPFFVSVNTLQLLTILMLVGVIVSRKRNIFTAVHNQRYHGYGEIFFALGILAATLITQVDWVLVIAILHMSLADGLAAVIGMKYGIKNGKYSVFGERKSLLGTFTFFGASSALVLWAIALLPGNSLGSAGAIVMMLVPFITTVCENASPKGSDNLVISVAVATLLTLAI